MKKNFLKTLGLIFALSCCFSNVACATAGGGVGQSNEDSTDNASSTSITDTESNSSDKDADSSDEDNSAVQDGGTDDLSIHFLYLGSTSGDCTLIKLGDTEVLIDAGATRGSADRVVEYIGEYCTDGVLEYVIVTHADQDHIAAFMGDENLYDGVFELFNCGTIIDFPKTTKDTKIYKEYVALRDKEVSKQGATHYTALECWNETKGAQRSYTLGEGVTLQILYQKYYEQSTTNENNNSVCVLVTEGNNNYLFTGDLESAGEKSLVESNDLPKCQVFKAGHHGSNTSNTTELISVIQPEIVVANCVGGDQYGFPHQAFINNVALYTQQLYVPSTTAGLLNGNVVITSDEGELSVNCSNNNTLFKDTDWFQSNRQTPDVWKA